MMLSQIMGMQGFGSSKVCYYVELIIVLFMRNCTKKERKKKTGKAYQWKFQGILREENKSNLPSIYT